MFVSCNIIYFLLFPVIENQGFSKDVCRSMVAMLDVDQSGKLGLEEFQTLLNDIAKWKAVFKLYDRDSSGKLSAFELREALNSAGYKLNNRILNALAHRYSSRDGMITFDDFIMCAVKIKTMMGECLDFKNLASDLFINIYNFLFVAVLVAIFFQICSMNAMWMAQMLPHLH